VVQKLAEFFFFNFLLFFLYISFKNKSYNLNFKGDNSLKSFEIESGREFSRKALKQIRTKLEELANSKGKDYIYFKKPPKTSKD